VQLLGSNASQEPANLYTVTVGGTVTSTDVLTLTFANPNIVNGTEAVAYTAQGGDTTTTIAAALAAAINADTILNGLGITATSAVAVVTVTYPNGVQPGQEGGSPTEPATQNVTVITGSLSGGATETLAVANASVGTNIGIALTALGITPFSILPPPRWIKAVVNTFTGTRVLANLHMVA
jgi:phage tail sheath gpL-like